MILVCLAICKVKHVLILQWQLINAQDSIMIHTFHMNYQLIVLEVWIIIEQEVKRIGRYLLDTRDKGMIYRPDITRGL